MQIQVAIKLMRLFLGVIFFWFGMLKFFSGVSPAESLAIMTIDKLFFGMIPPHISIKLLAFWEVSIGVGFVFGKYLEFVTKMFLLHMFLTFTPLFLLPDVCFVEVPFSLTIVGQYILKNLVFIMAGFLILSSQKGRKL